MGLEAPLLFDDRLLAWLTADTHPSIRGWLAANGRGSATVRAFLRRAGADERLHGLDRTDARLDVAELDALLAGGPWGRQVAASLDSAPANVLTRLATDPVTAVVNAVVAHPDAPLEALRTIAAIHVTSEPLGYRERQLEAAQACAAQRLGWPPAPARDGEPRPSGWWPGPARYWRRG